MTTLEKPALRPKNPRFSSGPCAKHPGWSLDALRGALLGRNHRAPETRARLALALERTRELLELPADYVAAIVPASDTGAVEMALWSLLGQRGVDVLAWEAFSRDWVRNRWLFREPAAQPVVLPNYRDRMPPHQTGAPGLVLVDEPTSRLDQVNAAVVGRLLADAARLHGATVIVATHDPVVIAQADARVDLEAPI